MYFLFGFSFCYLETCACWYTLLKFCVGAFCCHVSVVCIHLTTLVSSPQEKKKQKKEVERQKKQEEDDEKAKIESEKRAESERKQVN